MKRRALLHVHPTSHRTLVLCTPYQVAAWCGEVHWLKSALAARDSVGMCKSERDVCVALLFVVCYYHRIRSLPRAQSGRADHTLQSMQAPSVAFTMGVEGGSATLTSMKQRSHRLVKKLTSSACRATRYGQRLRTVLSGSPRCTRATMPRQFGVRGFRLGRALDFNMSLHVEELQVYDSLPLGASAYDTCYVCYQYRVHSTPVHVVQARASLRLRRVTGEFMEFLAQMPRSGTCHVIRSECRMCAGYIRVRLPAAAVKRRRGRSWLGVASLNAATNSSCTANLSRRHRHVSP